MSHRSSNITILLLPAVTNCETNSKTTRQRQWKSQSFFQICKTIFAHQFFPDIKRKHSIDQWNPLHLTDLGLTLIGIDQLLGVDQKDHHEVFLPHIEHLLTVLLLHLMASNGPSVLASNGPSILYLQFQDILHIRFQETLPLTYQALKACLIHPDETCFLYKTT